MEYVINGYTTLEGEVGPMLHLYIIDDRKNLEAIKIITKKMTEYNKFLRAGYMTLHSG